MALRDVLVDVDRPIEFVYFIETGVVSVVGMMADGTAVETATVGNEGFVGLPIFLGTDRTPSQIFCQISGDAFQMEAGAFRRELERNDALRRLLGFYTQALFIQVSQTSICNRLHIVEQRCARWLLQTHDRVGQDNFPLTQRFLSQMLGVRRSSVNKAAGILLNAGLIDYRYGMVTIVDRGGLERATCECYQIVAREFARLFDLKQSASRPRRATLTEGGKTLAKPPA